MRVSWLQHADFEGLGCIESWLLERGHRVDGAALYRGAVPPVPDGFDALIVMGGPMNVHQHQAHPWLAREKAAIRAALAARKRVLGICLGAQLIADALGATVRRNAEREIGWWPVELNDAGRAQLPSLPSRFTAFHWHEDSYALPQGAQCLAGSAACAQQAFSYDGGRVLGLQFHLEVRLDDARRWFEHERPPGARYVQTPEQILAQHAAFAENNRLMCAVLEQFFG